MPITPRPAHPRRRTRRGGILRRSVAGVLAAVVCLGAAVAAGADPAERETRFAEGLTFVFHPADRALAEELWPLMVSDRAAIMERLGLHPPGTLRVYLAPTERAFREAHGGAAPESALGLYFGATRTVLLRSPRSLPTGNWDLRGVMRHELAHGVLDLAIEEPVPLWLHEGLAILAAGELGFLDDSRLTWLAFREQLIPLDLLMGAFPAEGAGLDVAYAQAASFARYLLRRGGSEGLRTLVRHMAAGAGLHRAFVETYQRPLGELERDWRDGLAGRFSWAVLLTPIGLLGGIGGPLVLIGYLRRRLERRRRYREWEAEEAEQLRLITGEMPPRPLRRGDEPPRWLN